MNIFQEKNDILIHISVSKQLIDKLNFLCRKYKVTKSSAIREILNDWLETNEGI